MLVKTTENKDSITLLFWAAKNPKALNPNIEASLQFGKDLQEFLKKKFKSDGNHDINFLYDVGLEEISTINKEGQISRQYKAELILQKEPAKADTSDK